MARLVGLDIGTTYTRIWTQDGGVVLRCPSAAAIDGQTRKLVALGAEARKMLGKTPQDILASCPIKEGMVSEFDVAARMVRTMFLNKKICSTFNRPAVLLATPYRIDQVQQLAAENTVIEAGARAVAQVPAIFAAAAGAGLRVASPRGCMILDIGGGLSETAVISLGGIIAGRSLKVAGEKFDAAIMNYLRQKRNLVVGAATAEELRVRIGVCDSHMDRGSMTVYGRNARTGLASRQEVFSSEICEAITPAIVAIARTAISLLEEVPPEIAADIYDYGMMLTGGCALMPGMAEALHRETGLRVTPAEHPRDSVIHGLGRILNHPTLWGTPLEYRLK
ncbi:MAG: rod shape-determining protein [Ruminococcaceae bacterium]|nr:rod shape-determining protein [Oscillospiraceae bacterium]